MWNKPPKSRYGTPSARQPSMTARLNVYWTAFTHTSAPLRIRRSAAGSRTSSRSAVTFGAPVARAAAAARPRSRSATRIASNPPPAARSRTVQRPVRPPPPSTTASIGPLGRSESGRLCKPGRATARGRYLGVRFVPVGARPPPRAGPRRRARWAADRARVRLRLARGDGEGRLVPRTIRLRTGVSPRSSRRRPVRLAESSAPDGGVPGDRPVLGRPAPSADPMLRAPGRWLFGSAVRLGHARGAGDPRARVSGRVLRGDRSPRTGRAHAQARAAEPRDPAHGLVPSLRPRASRRDGPRMSSAEPSTPPLLTTDRPIAGRPILVAGPSSAAILGADGTFSLRWDTR